MRDIPRPAIFGTAKGISRARNFATRAVERPPRPRKLWPVGLGSGRTRMLSLHLARIVMPRGMRTPIPPAKPNDPDRPLLGETGDI